MLITSHHPLCWKKNDLLIGKVGNETSSHLLSTSCSMTSCKRKSRRAHPAISHCSHLLQKKCRVATYMSHWLIVQSRWFKNYIFAKKCILIGFLIFKYCSYYSFTFYYCAIYTLWTLDFFNTI